jgi:hypothetical protein
MASEPLLNGFISGRVPLPLPDPKSVSFDLFLSDPKSVSFDLLLSSRGENVVLFLVWLKFGDVGMMYENIIRRKSIFVTLFFVNVMSVCVW